MKLSRSLSVNKKRLNQSLSTSDVVFFDWKISDKRALVLYVDALTDQTQIGDLILRPLKTVQGQSDVESLQKLLPQPGSTIVCDEKDVISKTLEGNALLLIDGESRAISFDVKKFDFRAITEPPTSAVVRGPREGFTESIKANLSLLRRRVKTQNFSVEKFKVGRLTQTDVAIVYLSNIADNGVIDRLRKKIKSIDVDGIVDSSYIAKFIDEKKSSLFKQTGTTEKPDVLTAKILEGRVGVLVDGSPIALTVPYLTFEDFQSSEDYYQNTYRSNMARIVRVISLTLAVFLPSVFVSAQLFHLQIIPLNFLLTIVNSIKGIPLECQSTSVWLYPSSARSF